MTTLEQQHHSNTRTLDAIAEGAILIGEQNSLRLLKMRLQQEVAAKAHAQMPDLGREFDRLFCVVESSLPPLEAALLDAVKVC